MLRPVADIDNLTSSLTSELEITSNTSMTTLAPRSVIALVGSVMLSAVIGLSSALAWLALLAALEAALHWLARYAARRPHRRRVALGFVALTALIALAWSAVPIMIWHTGRPALQFAAMAILTAQLIDVQCNTFRLNSTSIVLGATPAALFLTLPIGTALLHRAPAVDTLMLIFCSVCTMLYFFIAIIRNRQGAQKLEASIFAAETASRAKSAFVAMISHELRTPLNGVIGLAHALKSAPSAAEREVHTDLIIRSGEILMALLNDILDLAKVEAGKLTLEPTDFDARVLRRDIYNLWAPIAAEKGLQLRCSYVSDRSPWVVGDEARIRQITSNLVSNALKFTSEGSVAIRVTLIDEPPNQVGFLIEVKDTGIGIRAEEQTRIFNPFAQARDSTSREFGGTGLGLAISRGFVDMMGGSLTVQSEAGTGSTFTLRLSLPNGTEPASLSPAAPTGLLDGARVLVVDDNVINLRVAVAILAALGAVPTTASGGAEALAVMRDAHFDLVLMDIHMPGIGGVETLNRIRAGQAGDRNIPVVACTADAMTNEVSRFLDLGFDAVQCKPILPGQLASTLAQVLSQTRSPPPDERLVVGRATI